MTRREKLCLQMRNKRGQGQENETYCQHYIKSKSVYLRGVFLGFKQVSCFIVSLICTVICVLNVLPDDKLFRILPWAFVAIFGVAWLFMVIKGLWYWKFTKHVFVTNEGIWVIGCSSMWWRGAPDFTGKRRFLAPYWSLYSWTELKKVTDSDDGRGRTVSKIANFFDDFDNFVIRSEKCTPVFLTRWDGVERIDCLKNADAQELLAYAKEQKRSLKKKEKEQQQEEITEE